MRREFQTYTAELGVRTKMRIQEGVSTSVLRGNVKIKIKKNTRDVKLPD